MSLAGDARAAWPIELLHPDGGARAKRRLGSGWSPVPGQPESPPVSSPLDLVVIAPGPLELRDPNFLRLAADVLDDELDADGLGYLLAPPRWRARLLSRLRRSDLREQLALAHWPRLGPEGYLLPLGGPGLEFGFRALASGRRLLSAVAALMPVPVLRLAARSLAPTGCVLRAAGARPLLEWMEGSSALPEQVAIRYRWGTKGGTAVVFCFGSRSPVPSRVGKVGLSGSSGARLHAEAEALASLRRSATAAGARVPDARIIMTRAGRPVMVGSYLPGRRAAQLLRAGTMTVADVLARLGAWLEQWNALSRIPGAIDAAWLQHHLLAPAMRLVPLLPNGHAYLTWLRGQVERAASRGLPGVASHNDLTMVNVLLQKELQPAILDWETAGSCGLPLADLCYAAVDAVASARRRVSRAAAYRRCFLDDGPERRLIAGLVERARQACGLSADLVPLCLHGCWVRHADNETKVTSTDHPRPFLKVLQLMAEQPG